MFHEPVFLHVLDIQALLIIIPVYVLLHVKVPQTQKHGQILQQCTVFRYVLNFIFLKIQLSNA